MHHANTLGELGKCHYGLGQIKSAIQYLNKAINGLAQFSDNQWACGAADEMRDILNIIVEEGKSS